VLNPSAETFTAEELATALALRQSVTPDRETVRRLNRRDQCPHQPACASLPICVERIAWYLRHRQELHAL